MRRRFMAAATAAASAAALLAGCGSGAGGGAGGPYRVLMTAGLSAQGTLAGNAATSVLAVKAGVAAVNEAGGVAGREVKLTVVDDEGNPTTALTNIRKAIASDRPDVVINAGPSPVTAATLPVLGQNEILSFNIAPTEDSADPKKNPLNFDLTGNPEDYIRGFIPYLREKGYKSAGIVHGSTASGVTFAEQMEPALEKAGITVAGNEEYDTAALDMTPQLQALKSRNPDVLIMDGYGAPVGHLLKGVEKLGWDVPIVGNNSVSATSLVSTPPPGGVLGTAQTENLVMQVYKSTVHDPDDTAVNDVVGAMTGLGKIESTLIMATNYDALPLIAAAAADAGRSDDPQALAEALEKPEVQKAAKVVIIGGYNFRPDSHGPNLTAEDFDFVAPSPLENGQFT